MQKSSNNKYLKTVGRRKTSSVSLRLIKGAGESMVNNKKLSEYFPGKINKVLAEKPLVISQLLSKYYFTAKVVGGGKRGQITALVHALSRAISTLDVEKYRRPLKRVGLLTRDSRSRLRRMVGTGGKARRQKQSPKR